MASAPPGGFGRNGVDITPEYDLRIVFDSGSPSQIEPATNMHREMTALREAQRAADRFNLDDQESLVTFREGVGYTLTADVDHLQYEQRESVGLGGILSVGAGTALASPYLVEEPTLRQDDDKPWIDSVVDFVTEGSRFSTLAIPADKPDSSGIGLAPDGHTHKTTNLKAVLHEVLRSTNDHDPRRPVVLRFMVPGSGHQSLETIAQLYFNGPVGRRTGSVAWTGTGQYALELHGNGRAELAERMAADGTWRSVYSFQWADEHGVCQKAHAIVIASDCFDYLNTGFISGRRITFGGFGPDGAKAHTYEAREPSDTEMLDVDRDKVRLFVRQEVRLRFQATAGVYLATPTNPGIYRGGGFNLTAIPSEERVLTLYAWTDVPTGADVQAEIRLGDPRTGTLLALQARGNLNGRGQWFNFFVPASTQVELFPAFLLYPPSDREHTPVLRAYSTFVPTAIEFGTLPETAFEGVTEVRIEQQSDDASIARAKVTIKDVEDSLGGILRVRASMPCRLELRYRATNPELWTPVFRGYLREAEGTFKGGALTKGIGKDRTNPANLEAYPSQDWWDYVLQLEGEYMRLDELVTLNVLDAGKDTTSGIAADRTRPMRVRDIVYWLYSEGGYPDSLLDVPQLETRFFQTEGDYLIEGFTGITGKLQDLAANYLGMYNRWDDSAGQFGMWRLAFYPKPSGGADDYNALAEFHDEPPGGWGAAGRVLVHDPALYPDTLEQRDLGGVTSGSTVIVPPRSFVQTVRHTFMQIATLRSKVVPPEANRVYVSGVGTQIAWNGLTPAQAAAGAPAVSTVPQNNGPVRLHSELINPYSAKFGASQPVPPDPTSPDYLGRPKLTAVFSRHLTSDAAVQFVCRRVFDRAAHGVTQLRFTAPALLVVDGGDDRQSFPRFLRYGDAVRYKGTTYIVRQCDPYCESAKGGARYMWAEMTIETPPRVHQFV